MPDTRKSKVAAPPDVRRLPPRLKKPRVDTAAIYEALHAMNEGFQGVYRAMYALNGAGLRKGDLFEGCRLLAEEARAWASYRVIEALSDEELTAWTAAGQRWQDWLTAQSKRAGKPGKRLPSNRVKIQKPRRR